MTTQASQFKLALTHQNKILVNYKIQLQQQQLLLDIIKAALPDTLRQHASYCVVTNRRILLYTSSAVWASQLRFYNNAMLSAVLKWRQNAYIEALQIRILTAFPINPTASRQAKIPSVQIIKQIGEARLNQIDTLSQALINLSKTLEKKRTTQ
ncbi:MAG: DciA family protein [Methylococcales bacterium]